MTNYVYHYLQTSKNLVDFFKENRFDFSVFPIDLKWKELDDLQSRIQFSTRGTKYPLNLVKEVLLQFPETIWYAMDENCVRQVEFKLDGGKVTVIDRKVTEADDDSILSLQLDDVNGRAQEYLFLFENGRLVIEHFLENKFSEVQLDGFENQKIRENLEWLCRHVTNPSWGAFVVDTLALEENRICCYIHFEAYHYIFENSIYEDDGVDEEMSYHFTIFYEHLKQLLENKRVGNIL